ncbi:MAG TPA: hypothetical protein PKC39_01060 [Ferruginibacter sp.]|nr:hypothetical protein [Ferruginibacter sp.]HMP19521.1 hypothetical protein [Ferruginibacter sp.]
MAHSKNGGKNIQFHSTGLLLAAIGLGLLAMAAFYWLGKHIDVVQHAH